MNTTSAIPATFSYAFIYGLNLRGIPIYCELNLREGINQMRCHVCGSAIGWHKHRTPWGRHPVQSLIQDIPDSDWSGISAVLRAEGTIHITSIARALHRLTGLPVRVYPPDRCPLVTERQSATWLPVRRFLLPPNATHRGAALSAE